MQKKIKIGVIGEHHSQNIGNNLLKYAMFIKLKELGFDPQIIGYLIPGHNISELNKIINIRIINKSFREINRNDYDMLMINSDQVWRYGNLFCFDIGFLNFSFNWNITKFIYGASLGSQIWKYKKNEDMVLKELLKEFRGVSVREKGTIKLVKDHLNITPTLVADPTLLIDKKYYLDLIKDYKNEFHSNDSYIFIYKVSNMQPMELFIKKSVKILKYKLYRCTIFDKDYLKRFIYGIYNCKAVITNSYHGILFSIIFKKPFVAFNSKDRGNDRFITLKNVYGLKKRIASEDNQPSISLLTGPFDVDMKKFDELRIKSIVYLKKNLGIKV
jgi:polysaccharide pyruvyl transferase WcaK-like protein